MEHLALFMQDFRFALRGCNLFCVKTYSLLTNNILYSNGFSISCKFRVCNETSYKYRLFHLFICSNRKKKKHKDKKRKAGDDEDKLDIVGMCVYYPAYLLIRW